MRKIIIMLLCFILCISLLSCGAKQKLPKDVSEDFYKKALEVNKEIEEIYKTKYFTFTDEKREFVNLYPIEISENHSEKEKFIIEVLKNTLLCLARYTTIYEISIGSSPDIDIDKETIREVELDFRERHQQYKDLLEIK